MVQENEVAESLQKEDDRETYASKDRKNFDDCGKFPFFTTGRTRDCRYRFLADAFASPLSSVFTSKFCHGNLPKKVNMYGGEFLLRCTGSRRCCQCVVF
ncbi:TPA: hypothetical protein DEP58_02925 [Patescibacteria group bacterium]|nr:MAG: hypothetical protein UU98_C0007G0037 [Parcubacteria group bacterium GW2011_GWD2_42_14]HCC05235.1 hypothetical protein [Patescibacteria group bacterium]